MQIITPYTKNKPYKNAIYLAGRCPLSEKEIDWHKIATVFLEKLKFTGTVINPVNYEYQSLTEKEKQYQILWEQEQLKKASAIVFFLDRDEKHSCLTSNIELGQYLLDDRVFICCPESSKGNDYIKSLYSIYNKKIYTNTESVMEAVVNTLNTNCNEWFISDTMFTDNICLKSIKTALKGDYIRNMNIISKWNKNIKINDIVFFLGNIGNTDVLKYLNYKKMYFVYGNTELDNLKQFKDTIAEYNDVYCCYSDNLSFVSQDGNEFVLRSSLNIADTDKDDFYLFGGGNGNLIENGINVSIQANNKPVKDIDILRKECLFYREF